MQQVDRGPPARTERATFRRPARLLRLLVLSVASLLALPSWAEPVVLVSDAYLVRYLANASDPGIGLTWVEDDFDDHLWSAGRYPMGYETDPPGAEDLLATVVPSATRSVYTRTEFFISDLAAVRNLVLRVDYDDGWVAWINGTLVGRSPEMATVEPLWDALTSSAHESSNAPSPIYEVHGLPWNGILRRGVNTFAIGVWNRSADSSDLVLAAELRMNDPTTLVTRPPYLQQATPDGIKLRWATSDPTDSEVRFGPNWDSLTSTAGSAAPRKDHEIALTGLTPDTVYFYSVGSSTEILAGADPEHWFRTPPLTGTRQPLRVWVIGDSGTADANAAAVYDAYRDFACETDTDVWLMLGDNAYPEATVANYDLAVFGFYPELLATTAVWTTFGNHEANIGGNANNTPPIARSATQTGPYYDLFTLPSAAEAGGLPSGTEAYYSFDYANVHFISLNSQDVSRCSAAATATCSTNPTMALWLEQDLAATAQDWIIAFWHHPPYSHGSHNSDQTNGEHRLVEMRRNILPILEDHGVDLVLTGHSHSYERSFLVDGHYGVSSTLTPAMQIDAGDGRPGGDGAYQKPTQGPAPHEGAVYVVAGSSGKVGSIVTPKHAVMVEHLQRLGSLVLDIDGDRLEGSFLDNLGDVRDHFTLVKDTASPPQADFSATPRAGVAPLTVRFVDASSSNAAAHSWDFDDDGTGDSLLRQPTFTYATAGTYTVSLTVSNDAGSDTRTRVDYIEVATPGGGPDPGQPTLTSSDAAPYDGFGALVAIAGNTVVVAAPADDDLALDSGSAYVFQRIPGGGWAEIQKLGASDAAFRRRFGGAVAIDEDVIVVGDQRGSAYVFEPCPTGWAETARWNFDPGAFAPVAVAVSSDTIAVGINRSGVPTDGAVFVFVRNAQGEWVEQQVIAPPVPGAAFGTSVALRGDLLFVGAPSFSGDPGTGVHVFRRNQGVWATTQSALRPGEASPRFGGALGFDGSTLVVGDTEVSDGNRAYVFEIVGSTWALTQTLSASDGMSEDDYARSVTVDGDRIVVGAAATFPYLSSPGSAYLYERLGDGSWPELESEILISEDPVIGNAFGASVALLGNTLIVGEPGRMPPASGRSARPAATRKRATLGIEDDPGSTQVFELDCDDPDADGDGFAACAGDCADDDPARHPGAAERCDAIDNDCDGATDEGCDDDGDGYCDAALPVAAGAGCVANPSDCDDGNPLAYPQAFEHCDGADNDCNGLVDEGATDVGAACSTGLPGVCGAGSTSCLDGAIVCVGSRGPGAELCNGVDDDCDGVVDNERDTDGDGVSDCADSCPAAFSAAQTDSDGDGRGDVCDCAPADPGNPVPDTVTATLVMLDSDTLALDDSSDSGPFLLYRGWRNLHQPFSYNHVCARGAPVSEPVFEEYSRPLQDVTLYYLVSRTNGCGESGVGSRSDGTPRPQPAPCPLPGNDPDGDGVAEPFDVCPLHHDPDQADFDGDGLGDVCDPAPQFAEGDLIVAGFQTFNDSPVVGASEFVELFNATDRELPLDDLELQVFVDNDSDGVVELDWALAADLGGRTIAPYSFFLIAESGVPAEADLIDLETELDLATAEGGSAERALSLEVRLGGIHMDFVVYGRHDGSTPPGEIPPGDLPFDPASFATSIRSEVVRNTTGATAFLEGVIRRISPAALHAGHAVAGFYTDEPILGDGYPTGIWESPHTTAFVDYQARNSSSTPVPPD